MAWLLDSDPAIRWQVLRDLASAPPEVVAGERARVAREGWGARLLTLQQDDGNWGGGSYSPKWVSTTYTLLLLRHFGPDPDDPAVRAATDRVAERVLLGSSRQPFFTYRGELCITGMVLALASTFRPEHDASAIVDYLLEASLGDGGWNCEWGGPRTSPNSSFNTTLSILEGLAAFERHRGPTPAVSEQAGRAREYLLERSLFRSKRTGEVIDPKWLLFSFPPRWFYDVLRALDHLQDVATPVDSRIGEALDLVEKKRRKDGTWPLQHHHAGREHFRMEDPGRSSRWNTLRAMRVLRWAGR